MLEVVFEVVLEVVFEVVLMSWRRSMTQQWLEWRSQTLWIVQSLEGRQLRCM